MKKQLLLLSILLLVFIGVKAQSTIYFVKTDGNNDADGTTWETAKQSVQSAIDAANFGDSVFVKQGHYILSTELIPKDGVNVYGGFTGTETSSNERPHLIYGKTEEGQASILDANADENNRRRVITQETDFSIETVWDGFIIQNGYSPVGGGILFKANAKINNSYIFNNRAGSSDGGGIYLESGGTISNCNISNNIGGEGGGVYFLRGGNIFNSLIVNNTSYWEGGGICLQSGGIISNCYISNNIGYIGGGIYFYGSGTIFNSIIANNTSYQQGGGIYCSSTSNIANCSIINNLSWSSGGGASYYASPVRLSNCILWGNKNNNIFDQMADFNPISVAYCAIQNGYNGTGNINIEGDNSGTDIYKFYPAFINPTNFAGKSTNTSDSLQLLNADWQLSRSSICVNGGNNNLFENPEGALYCDFDIAGNPRTINNTIDIGAYEFNNFNNNEEEQHIIWEQDISELNLIRGIAELTAIASSGLPVSYISSDINILSIENNYINIIRKGTATITAIQNGNDDYFPATRISKTVRVLNNEAHLNSLTIPDRVLNPSFNREIFNYTVTVGLDVETITINAAPYDNNASISENSDIGEKNIEIGSNEFTITVIAEDGITTQDYTITVIRKQIDATLSNLSASIGEFSPEFDPDITEYYMNDIVESIVTSILITAIPNDENSTVTGDGDVALIYGTNILEISVLAEDRITIKTYKITLNREITTSNLPPANGYDILSPNIFTAIGFGDTIPPPYIASNTFDISGFDPNMAISSINDIERIFLNIEHSYLNDLSIHITCPNGQSCVLKAYRYGNPSEVTEIATPGSEGGGSIHLGFSPDPRERSDLCYLTPGVGMYYWFTPAGTNSFGTGGPTTSISYGDPCEKIETWQQLNSGEYGSYENFNSLIGCPVNGDWSITITDNLSADNGYLFEWGITFAQHTPPIINDASLINITVSEGILTPEFDPQTFEYSVNVESNIEISATTNNSNASITEDSNIGAQNLDYGNNEFNVTVVAEDGATSLTYIITVNREMPNNDATLTDIAVSEGELTPEFNPQTFEYNVNVGYNVETIEIFATTNNSNATITEDSNIGIQDLNYGENEFYIITIAEDGITSLTYSISVNREMPGDDATLVDISVSEGILAPIFDPQIFEYTVNVEHDIETIEISATTSSRYATITENSNIGVQNLNYGTNEFSITVIAEDLNTTEIYHINVIRGYNSINNHETTTFAIYPNPAKNYINLDLTELKENTTVQIINELGVVCYEQKLQGGIIHKISTVNFAKGIYFVLTNDKLIKLIIK